MSQEQKKAGRPKGSQNRVNRNLREKLEVMFNKGVPYLDKAMMRAIRAEDDYTLLQILQFLGKKVIADKKEINEDGTDTTKVEIKIIRE